MLVHIIIQVKSRFFVISLSNPDSSASENSRFKIPSRISFQNQFHAQVIQISIDS